MARRAPWLALGAVAAGAGWALGAVGVPSPYLFAALLVGLAAALALPSRVELPRGFFTAAQAVTGVVLGAYVQSSSLEAIADSWLPVTLVSLATLGVSLAAGVAIARLTHVDPSTGALGMVAGGASGIVSMADELGADARLVAFMQYLRVLVVVLLTPVIVAIAFPGHDGGPIAGGGEPVLGDAKGWLITIAVAGVGGLAGRMVRLPAASLLGPMILAGAITLALPGGEFTVPPLLREVAFALIGLEVGLRFTVEAMRQARRLLVPVLAAILALIVASLGLAVLLDVTTPVSLLDAYLATTPGGFYAVLAVAFGAEANTTFIIAVQGLRIFVMVLLAPFAVRWLVRASRVKEAA